MFSFNPIPKSESDELFKKNGLKVTDTSMAVVSINSEDNKSYGFCLFDYKDLIATILSLEYNENFKFLPECLIKAALNYVANRGAYIAESNNLLIKNELLKLGFKQEGNLLTAEIPKVMKGNCCSCQNI